MRNNSILVLEIIWIITGLLSIVGAVKSGGSRTYLFILMAIISFIFAWLRHQQRKKN